MTESDSRHDHLERWSVDELLRGINQEDHSVPGAVERAIPMIVPLVERIVESMAQGGRLFYIGAGTSGRLGIVDASECPPTFGVDHGLVIGLIAGGDRAIRYPVEFAEDDRSQGWADLQAQDIGPGDVVIGIAASGSTPYVIGALEKCREAGITTGCITCNPGAPVLACADYPVLVAVGPEFVTGSTRMKSGTAQKLVLNMISTSAMIRLGRVRGNKMVDMQLSNRKLVHRGTRMVMDQTGLSESDAASLLRDHGSVRKAVDAFRTQ
ncbi:MAG: N-acetylmuramic acid 6-phosphate etherase [Flavobacteriales bacterium]